MFLNLADAVADAFNVIVCSSACPTLTIVTICRNTKANLEATVSSVLGQVSATDSFEYLVIDGASTDDTVRYLGKIADHRLAWTSEPDRGISDAMNKGIQRARGLWIMHLHAGDRLVEGGIRQIFEILEKNAEADIVCSAIIKEEPSGDVICEAAPERLPVQMTVPHPGVIARTAVWRSLGGFDENLRNAMDYDLFLRAWVAGARFVAIADPLTRFAAGGQSDTSLWQTLAETHQIRRKHLTKGWSRSLAFLVALWAKGLFRIALQKSGFTAFVSWYRDHFAYPRKTSLSR